MRIARGRASWRSLAGTGAAIGLAAACKVTGLALLGPAGFAVLASALFTESGRRQKARALAIAAGRGLIVLAAAFAAVRVTFPYGFAGLFRLDPRWLAALKELSNLTKGYGFPPRSSGRDALRCSPSATSSSGAPASSSVSPPSSRSSGLPSAPGSGGTTASSSSGFTR